MDDDSIEEFMSGVVDKSARAKKSAGGEKIVYVVPEKKKRNRVLTDAEKQKMLEGRIRKAKEKQVTIKSDQQPTQPAKIKAEEKKEPAVAQPPPPPPQIKLPW